MTLSRLAEPRARLRPEISVKEGCLGSWLASSGLYLQHPDAARHDDPALMLRSRRRPRELASGQLTTLLRALWLLRVG